MQLATYLLYKPLCKKFEEHKSLYVLRLPFLCIYGKYKYCSDPASYRLSRKESNKISTFNWLHKETTSNLSQQILSIIIILALLPLFGLLGLLVYCCLHLWSRTFCLHYRPPNRYLRDRRSEMKDERTRLLWAISIP